MYNCLKKLYNFYQLVIYIICIKYEKNYLIKNDSFINEFKNMLYMFYK